MLILLFSTYSSFSREIYLGIVFANKCDMWIALESNFCPQTNSSNSFNVCAVHGRLMHRILSTILVSTAHLFSTELRQALPLLLPLMEL